MLFLISPYSMFCLPYLERIEFLIPLDMKFILGYRTELFMIFLVPIRAIRWYRFVRYNGTVSCDTMVPFDRYYHIFLQLFTQTCVIHQIRNSCKYVVYKDKKEFRADIKNIYIPPTKRLLPRNLTILKRNGEESILMLYFHRETTGMT